MECAYELDLDYFDYDTLLAKYRVQGALSPEMIEEALKNTLMLQGEKNGN